MQSCLLILTSILLSGQACASPQAAIVPRLNYSGLTWDKVHQVLARELGEDNLDAVNDIVNALGNFDPDNPNDPKTLVQFLKSSALEINFTELTDGAIGAITKQLKDAAPVAMAQIAAKFVPGAGTLNMILNGVDWISNNSNTLTGLFDKLVAAINPLKQRDVNAVAAKFTEVLTDAIVPMLDLGATQLGLGRLRNDVKGSLNYLPTKVDELLTKAIRNIAKPPGIVPNQMFKGKLDGQALQPFAYPDPNTNYVLWAARDSSGAKVKVARVNGSGYDFIGELKASSFENTPAVQQHINALLQKANTLDNLLRSPQTANRERLAAIRTAQLELRTAEQAVIEDIKANACKALNTGCFAADVLFWTKEGWRRADEVLPGEWVYSRDEFDVDGTIELKLVEDKFQRTGRIHVIRFDNGYVLRTTQEHPFWKQEEGWTEAGGLRAGDVVRTKNGWTKIEEVTDTEEYETVYNIRVADWHTYFVGNEGFAAVWAHNDYKQLADVLKNAPDVQSADDATLLQVAKQMPQAGQARNMSLATFMGLLETKLINKGLLDRSKHLSDETVLEAKAAAEIHGNTGRSPSILIDPNAANPYTPGTIAAGRWDAITAFHNENPSVNALRLRLHLPGQANGGAKVRSSLPLCQSEVLCEPRPTG